MQLTQHTDYGLRVLLALGTRAPETVTAAEIAEAYSISVHHVLKVIQRLAELGYVETLRGRGGGVRLGVDPASLRVGAVVRQLEPDLGVVACLRQGDTPCVIEAGCGLKGALQRATEAFLAVLDDVTLADVMRSKRSIGRLLQLGKSA